MKHCTHKAVMSNKKTPPPTSKRAVPNFVFIPNAPLLLHNKAVTTTKVRTFGVLSVSVLYFWGKTNGPPPSGSQSIKRLGGRAVSLSLSHLLIDLLTQSVSRSVSPLTDIGLIYQRPSNKPSERRLRHLTICYTPTVSS